MADMDASKKQVAVKAASETKTPDVFLNDVWVLWFHSPECDDWRLESYVQIAIVSSVDDAWKAINSISHWIPDGMFFLMREYVSPTWDDPAVIDGGSYSIRVPREHASDAFRDMCFVALGETLLAESARDRWDEVRGLSISPKNHHCVLKIWMSEPEPPAKELVWMPSCRTEEVFFSMFRESIIRSKKPLKVVEDAPDRKSNDGDA